MERVPDDYFDYDYDNHHNDPYMMIVVNVCPKNDLKKLCLLRNHAPGKRWFYPNDKFPVLRACHHVPLVAAPVKAKHL